MFLKNRNISSKIKRSKVTDYAALNCSHDGYFVLLTKPSHNSSRAPAIHLWHYAAITVFCNKGLKNIDSEEHCGSYDPLNFFFNF